VKPPQSAIPDPVVRRLAQYLLWLRDSKLAPEHCISSTALARAVGVKPTSVRQDFLHLQVKGLPNRGYRVESLELALTDALGLPARYLLRRGRTKALLRDAYRGLGELDKAILWWEETLKVASDNPFLQTRIGDGLRRLGEEEKALAYFARALSLDENNAKAVQGVILILKQEGHFVVDDHWVQLAAEYAMKHYSIEEAALVLRHISGQGRQALPGSLKELL